MRLKEALHLYANIQLRLDKLEVNLSCVLISGRRYCGLKISLGSDCGVVKRRKRQ